MRAKLSAKSAGAGARRQARPGPSPALLAAALLSALLLPASGVLAHESKSQAVDPERPELAFGRSADHDYDPPLPGSYRLPPLGLAGDGAVLTEAGEAARLKDLLAGRITILSFIYTRCSDASGCPLATGVLHDIRYISEQDPEIRDNLQLISFSFDPAYDTPEVMAEYGAGMTYRGEAAPWHFLTAPDRAALKPILTAYGQPVAPAKSAGSGFDGFTHQLRVFLIDRKGRIRNIYSSGFLDPRLLLADVRTLLLEEQGVVLGN